MLFRAFYLITIILSIGHNSWAQNDTTLLQGKITFTGLQNLKESYLIDQLDIDTLEIFDIEKIKENNQILKNIPGIGQSEYQTDTIDQKINTTFNINEIRTLLPIINFGGIKNNLWYQIGITDNNWFGKGQQVAASYQNNNGRHSAQFFFKAPRIVNNNFGYSISLSSWRSLEPLYFSDAVVDYEYNINSLGFTGIYNYTINRRFEIGTTAFIEKYKKSKSVENDNLPGPNSLTQNKFLSKVEYDENYINYHYFYFQGYEWKITYQNVFTVNDKTWFNSLQAVGKFYFRPYNNSNFAIRFKLGIASNDDSPFAPFVVDSHTNLRGVGNRIDRGTAQAVINAEYRHTIWHEKKWGAQVVGFTDIGTWRNPGGGFDDLYHSDNFRQFVGGGFRLIYQEVFGATLRIDYGVDIYNREDKGIVIGLGQYF